MITSGVRYILFLFFLILIPAKEAGALTAINGKVTDEKNQPLPYANVYIKGTSIGTATNFQGVFQLKLEEGKYELVFQYIGYKKRSEFINVATKSITLNIKLQPEEITLAEVTIKAEDPSYPIIRKAIARKDYYRKQVGTYTCDVFAKSLFRLTNAPRKMFGEEILDKGDTLGGIFYLSESVSEISFRQPGRVKEVMVSSKVSGADKGFSFNFYSFFMLSFYDNLVHPPLGNSRGYVSPLSDNAFLYYRYKLEGSYMDGNKKIYKIRVIPRRSMDPVFSGYIYIVDNDYRIHSVDLKLPPEAKINFVDSLKLSQQFVPVNDTVWMILSQKIQFFFSIDLLGKKFGGNGIFNSQNTDYKLNVDFPKDYFGSEYIRIQPTANKKDSAYWAANRPIPLTEEELKNYHKMDSVQKRQSSKPYMDSIQRRENRFRPGILWNGYTYHNRYDSVEHTFSTPLTTVQFNTVQGWNAKLEYTRTKTYDDRRRFRFDDHIEYGFSDKTFRGEAGIITNYDPEHFAIFGIQAGYRSIRQIDPSNPITPLENSLYSVISEENFMKIYEKSFLSISHSSEIFHGMALAVSADCAWPAALENHFNSPVTDVEGRTFSPNLPEQPVGSNSVSGDPVLYTGLDGTYTIAQRYAFLPYRIALGSKYPRISFRYRKGFYLPNGDAGFDYLELNIGDGMKLGLLGQIRYQLSWGSFLGTNPSFIDARHFSGNRTIFAQSSFNAFQVLDYYTYSSGKEFLDAHVEHHFNGWLFNKIPLLKRSKLREVAGLHYLHNDMISDYWEFNFGIENLFNFARLDYVTSFNGSRQMRDGVVIRIPLFMR